MKIAIQILIWVSNIWIYTSQFAIADQNIHFNLYKRDAYAHTNNYDNSLDLYARDIKECLDFHELNARDVISYFVLHKRDYNNDNHFATRSSDSM